jgi:hypothetical protein
MHDIRPFIKLPFEKPGTLLYVGARPDANSWLTELYDSENTITVLEIWQENVDGLENDTRIDSLICGDIRNVDNIFKTKFDYIFWWHGPEHVEANEIRNVISKLEKKTKKLIAVAYPYGIYTQGPHNGNPNEEHKHSLYPDDFKILGYNIKTDGMPDQPGSEVVAWKIKGK